MERIRTQKSLRHLIERFNFFSLLIPLIILATVTAIMLFLNSDPKVNELFTSCLKPNINYGDDTSSPPFRPFYNVPIIGAPACCLLSFFHAAMTSRRSFVIMNEILSYVGALLTATTIESARVCNQSSWMIRNPTPSWLLFNLAGGAVIWQLAIVPSFLRHEKKWREESCGAASESAATTASATERHDSSALAQGESEQQPLLSDNSGDSAVELPTATRGIDTREIPAVAISVAFGYFLPCLLILFKSDAWPILIWLFFPLLVSIVRRTVRQLVPSSFSVNFQNPQQGVVHPESSRLALGLLYALPLIWSVIAHVTLIHDLIFTKDDRSPTTKAALGFIQADFGCIGLTVLYWIAVKAGWRVTLSCVLVSCVLGPGAGLCYGWVLREEELKDLMGQRSPDSKCKIF